MLKGNYAIISHFDVGNKILGNIVIKITTGRPIIVGVMKEANRFSFILFLKGWTVFALWCVLILGWGNKCTLRLLVEI